MNYHSTFYFQQRKLTLFTYILSSLPIFLNTTFSYISLLLCCTWCSCWWITRTWISISIRTSSLFIRSCSSFSFFNTSYSSTVCYYIWSYSSWDSLIINITVISSITSFLITSFITYCFLNITIILKICII